MKDETPDFDRLAQWSRGIRVWVCKGSVGCQCSDGFIRVEALDECHLLRRLGFRVEELLRGAEENIVRLAVWEWVRIDQFCGREVLVLDGIECAERERVVFGGVLDGSPDVDELVPLPEQRFSSVPQVPTHPLFCRPRRLIDVHARDRLAARRVVVRYARIATPNGVVKDKDFAGASDVLDGRSYFVVVLRLDALLVREIGPVLGKLARDVSHIETGDVDADGCLCSTDICDIYSVLLFLEIGLWFTVGVLAVNADPRLFATRLRSLKDEFGRCVEERFGYGHDLASPFTLCSLTFGLAKVPSL